MLASKKPKAKRKAKVFPPRKVKDTKKPKSKASIKQKQKVKPNIKSRKPLKEIKKVLKNQKGGVSPPANRPEIPGFRSMTRNDMEDLVIEMERKAKRDQNTGSSETRSQISVNSSSPAISTRSGLSTLSSRAIGQRQLRFPGSNSNSSLYRPRARANVSLASWPSRSPPRAQPDIFRTPSRSPPNLAARGALLNTPPRTPLRTPSRPSARIPRGLALNTTPRTPPRTPPAIPQGSIMNRIPFRRVPNTPMNTPPRTPEPRRSAASGFLSRVQTPNSFYMENSIPRSYSRIPSATSQNSMMSSNPPSLISVNTSSNSNILRSPPVDYQYYIPRRRLSRIPSESLLLTNELSRSSAAPSMPSRGIGSEHDYFDIFDDLPNSNGSTSVGTPPLQLSPLRRRANSGTLLRRRANSAASPLRRRANSTNSQTNSIRQFSPLRRVT